MVFSNKTAQLHGKLVYAGLTALLIFFLSSVEIKILSSETIMQS